MDPISQTEAGVPAGQVVAPIQQAPNISNNDQQNNKKKLIIIGFVITLLLITFLAIIFATQKNEPLPQQQATPTKAPAKNVLTLKKSIKTIDPTTGLSLTFSERSAPEEGCNDCYSSTNIEIEMNGKKQTLSFVCGGIAGNCDQVLSGLGFKINMEENLHPEEIKISIAKE